MEAPIEMVNYIENTISLIDRMFYGKTLDHSKYYNNIIYKWWMEKEKDFGVLKSKRKVSARAITDYLLIRPKYSYNGEQAVLIIPSIRLKDNFFDVPKLNIYHMDELVDSKDMCTFGSGITMATKECSLYVDNLVFKDDIIACKIEIVHAGKIIYSSKSSLFREYILFKDNREILQEECIPGNYLLFASNLEAFSAYPKSVKKKSYEPNLYYIYSQEGELLQTRGRTVCFVTEMQNRKIKTIANIKRNVKFIHNGEEYIVVDGELEIAVESDIDITKYGVRYESIEFKLKDMPCIESEGYKLYCITELLNVGEPQRINIFNYAGNKIEASYSVVKFSNISIAFDKALYFDRECVGVVRFHTEKYDRSASFNINQGDIIIPLNNGDIIITPPVLRWKISDSDFFMKYGEDLWYKDYSNSAELTFELPPEFEYQVILNSGELLPEGNSLNSFKLGEIALAMAQDDKSELVVCIKINNKDIISILTMCLKEKLKFSPFTVRGKELLWDASAAFIGGDVAKFRLSFYENGELKHSLDINETISESYQIKRFDLSNLEIGVYNITVDLVKRIAFREQSVRLIERQVIIGSRNKVRFKGKCLHVEKAMLTGESSYRKIKPFYVGHLWYIGEENGCCYYTGQAYIVKPDGSKIYLNSMPNSEGTYDNINPIRIELKSEKSCFIVAGVNPDDMRDFLGEFTLDTRNRISNFNRGTRGIDYFLFEIEEAK